MASSTNLTVEISRQDLQKLSAEQAAITNVKHLSSYSWIEAPHETPTIAVPGIPPRWSPPQGERQLPKDHGYTYISQNAFRHPESPLEPLFRALYVTDPEFDINSIDVVTDRNNIRKLLTFIDPSLSRSGRESFVINVEVCNNTVIFARTETETRRFIGPDEYQGYGHEFEKAYTTCDISRSTGHHRINNYKFGGMNFIVRYEVDAYVQTESGMTLEGTEPSIDNAPAPLGSTPVTDTVHVNALKTSRPTGSKMTIHEEGRTIPSDSILEMKARVNNRPLKFGEVASQLWVCQTPKLVVGYHSQGTFSPPHVKDVSAAVKEWERAHESKLQMLVALIKRILKVARGYGGSVMVRYDPKHAKNKLVITSVGAEGKRVLPEDLYSRWDAKEGTVVTPSGS